MAFKGVKLENITRNQKIEQDVAGSWKVKISSIRDDGTDEKGFGYLTIEFTIIEGHDTGRSTECWLCHSAPSTNTTPQAIKKVKIGEEEMKSFALALGEDLDPLKLDGLIGRELHYTRTVKQGNTNYIPSHKFSSLSSRVTNTQRHSAPSSWGERVPADTYSVEIVGIRDDVDKFGNTQGVFRFRIVEGELSGTTIVPIWLVRKSESVYLKEKSDPLLKKMEDVTGKRIEVGYEQFFKGERFRICLSYNSKGYPEIFDVLPLTERGTGEINPLLHDGMYEGGVKLYSQEMGKVTLLVRVDRIMHEMIVTDVTPLLEALGLEEDELSEERSVSFTVENGVVSWVRKAESEVSTEAALPPPQEDMKQASQEDDDCDIDALFDEIDSRGGRILKGSPPPPKQRPDLSDIDALFDD